MELFFTEAAEALYHLSSALSLLGYKTIQHIPGHRISKHPGRELYIFNSFLFKNRFILFKGSFLQPVYEKVLRAMYPAVYKLYKFFFLNERLSREGLIKILKKEELDTLSSKNIISVEDGYCTSRLRIIPVGDLIIVCSPQTEFDTPKYVYAGEDSIVFYYLLEKEVKQKVNNALEIGCGTGLLSIWMSKHAEKVTSVDINNRALDITNTNARINGVKNIVTKNSDVYSDLSGKFDLIISNPPYVFLPDKNIGRTFAYGGNLGLEILTRILLGLDEHLSDTGTCYMIFFSYIKYDGTNTAYEKINEIFKDKPYSVELRQIDYYPIKHYPSFYKEQGISHTIRYMVKIKKSDSYEMNHIQIRGFSKMVQKLKIKF